MAKTYLCVVCGKEFEPYRGRRNQRFCSTSCRNRCDKDDRRFSSARAYVIERDNGCCCKCGKDDGLVVHHKDKNRFNNDPSNLITLCRSCHAKVHYPDTWIVKPETRRCIICNGEYHPIQKHQKLCRRKVCLREWKKLQKRSQHESTRCEVCGKVFVQKHSNHKTCSPECRHEYDKQKKLDRYYTDRDAQLERQKRYYERNKDKVKAYVTKWRKRNPDKVASYYCKSGVS